MKGVNLLITNILGLVCDHYSQDSIFRMYCKYYNMDIILQMNDILALKGEVKQLQLIAQQLEPIVQSFSAGITAGELSTSNSDAASYQRLQALLDHISRFKMQETSLTQMPVPTKESRHLQSIINEDSLYTKRK